MRRLCSWLVGAWLCAAASALAPSEPVLGPVVHARGAIAAMNRTELEAELADRRMRCGAEESDDALRVRLMALRAQLLQRRTGIVGRAETVMHELELGSGDAALAELSLDTVLADDNAILANAMGNKMLGGMKQQVLYALAALVARRAFPLAAIRRSYAVLLPSSSTPRLAVYGALSLAAAQLALRYARRLLAAPSYFCRKLMAVTCREGLIQWMLEADEAAVDEAAAAAAAAAPPPRPLLLRRSILEPIGILCAGSSIFEEVVFRGFLLHALVTRVRLRPMLATLLSSALFGAMHAGNEASRTLRGIYTAWTFVGGVVFGAAYLNTRGGLLLPVALHFGLNAIIFGDSARQVARKLLEERRAMNRIVERLQVERQQQQQALDAAVGGRGDAPPAQV